MPNELAALILLLIAQIHDANARLKDSLGEDGAEDRWEADMARILALYLLSAYLLGVETEEIADTDATALSGLLNTQLEYLSGFKDDIKSSDEWQDGWDARAERYAQSIGAGYELGRLSGLDNDSEGRWMTNKELEHCGVCVDLDDQIHTIKWFKQNHIPKDGNTPCGGSCGCVIVPM